MESSETQDKSGDRRGRSPPRRPARLTCDVLNSSTKAISIWSDCDMILMARWALEAGGEPLIPRCDLQAAPAHPAIFSRMFGRFQRTSRLNS